jgi:His-Xaa-Ser system protein HxsD
VSSDAAEGFSSQIDSKSSATIYLDARIYSKEAALKASYWYTDIAFVSFPDSPEGKLTVHIKLKQPAPTLESPKPSAITEVVDEFCNSLLDFELRHQVDVETAAVRQLILAKAFSESGVLEDKPPGSVGDPVEVRTPSSLVQILNPPKT